LGTSLRVGGAGLGLGALGVGGFVATHQPRNRILPALAPDDASRPRELTTPKRVVVVGGGLAGLSTAIELAERKFQVTLIERAAHLGGKLGGWKVDVNGETFPMEHGFHGFFAQYHNLYDLLGRVGATANLAPPPAYPIVFPDRPEERFGELSTIFPLNLLEVVHQSKTLRLADFARDGYATMELMKWNGQSTYDKFDSVDFRSFTIDGRMNRGMRENIMEPFGKTTLNRLPRLSAAEGLRFFHFFFIGNPDGLWYRYSKQDALTDVITPLADKLRALGGVIRAGTPVRRLILDRGRVSGVELEPDGVSLGAQVRVASSSIPTSGFLPLAGPDGSAVYVTRHGAGFVAFDARCTHMGCPVRVDESSGGFACPCHGGRFNSDGVPTAGPPQRPLRSLPVVHAADELLIGDPAAISARGEIIDCDYAVSACEVRGTRALMKASDLRAPELERRVAALGESDPYLVYRVWIDGKVRPDRTSFYTCAGYRYLDSLAIYTMLQEPYISWGKRTGKTVLELHSYAVAPEDMRPSDELARSLIDDARRVLPELKDAPILHGEYQEQSNFSRFAPGDHASRPSTETEIGNLFLAGDHVKMAPAVALMEAATMSGRFAANAILRKEKLREVSIFTVAEKGPLA
jgi:carotenoid phi-ring synthase / carotenoid chi-ring synthase